MIEADGKIHVALSSPYRAICARPTDSLNTLGIFILLRIQFSSANGNGVYSSRFGIRSEAFIHHQLIIGLEIRRLQR